jgi:hypothetical protein
MFESVVHQLDIVAVREENSVHYPTHFHFLFEVLTKIRVLEYQPRQ